MPEDVRALAPYLHTVISFVSIAFAVHVASLGFGGRRRSWRDDLPRHGSLAPRVAVAFAVLWSSGVASVLWLRDDLELAGSRHFWLGTAIVGLLAGSTLTSRWIDRPLVRAVHPWLGAIALVLCGFQAFLGFDLLP